MSSDKHKLHAAECVRLAQLAHDPESKALLLKMADAWLRLADNTDGASERSTSEKSES
jgi:hypothetical protein